MKLIFIIHFLLFQNPPTPPLGEWLHKEDSSLIELFQQEDKLYGRLTSTKNPKYDQEKIVLRNFEFLNGKWKGEFYSVDNKRWMEAELIVAKEILVVNYKYGFIAKKFQLNKN